MENGKHKTGLEGRYRIKNNQKMRLGYTTGTCAAAAARGAAALLLSRERPAEIRLITPAGITLSLEPELLEGGENWALCGVRKDAGDDPDITDGLLVTARVEYQAEAGIRIAGGEGVGRVTRPGLEQPVGSPAINQVPRKMIIEGLQESCQQYGYDGGLLVTISVPEGRQVAEKTFNPRLGIEGGISILGTSGIVEPMSEQALVKSIEVEMRQQIAGGRRNLLATLGNYGRAYLEGLEDIPLKDSIKCSNYVGEVIDLAVELGAERVLFVAHLGKFIKVAGGIMNTHSRCADSRAEIMASCALLAGADRETAMRLLQIQTTDEGLAILRQAGLQDKTMDIVMRRIAYYLDHRAYSRIRTDALVFSNAYGYLGETDGCRAFIAALRAEGRDGLEAREDERHEQTR